MDISIIIPTYNRAALVQYTLDSVRQERHPGVKLEVIVVDDHSTDDTRSVISANYPSVRLLTTEGKGAPAARNTGLQAATGKYVLYLDSDDLIGEHHFLKKIAFLNDHPQYQACYGDYDYFESNDGSYLDRISFKHKYPDVNTASPINEHLKNYLMGQFLPPNTIIWRRDFLLSFKAHDLSLEISQDVDLFINAVFNGLQIAKLSDGTKAYIRNHQLDTRVGNPASSKKKYEQVLAHRTGIYEKLEQYGFTDKAYFRAMSLYFFRYWRILWHTEPELADRFLNMAKKVYWPIQLEGGGPFRIISKFFGPVAAIKLKYLLFKRDI